MDNVQSHYLINNQTAVLLAIDHEKYKTIVLEAEKEILVNKTALQIIKDSCLHYGSSYDGRKQSVTKQFNYKRKVPIPISIANNIYTFPTHAVKNDKCIWFFSHHLSETLHPTKKNKTRTEVFLKNGDSLNIDCSLHIIKKQIRRTILCKAHFSRISSFS